MRPPGAPARAGAHCSDSWEVDSPWHRHDMHQLLYAIEGSVEVEGALARYMVPSQFAVWIPAGVAHRTKLQRIRSGSIFLSSEMIETDATHPRVIRAPALMREMVIHAMRWPLDREPDRRSDTYFTCFATLCSDWIEARVELVIPASDDARIAAAAELTRRKLATVRFGEVAKAAGMSERTLRRHFGEAMGIGWEEYRRRLRICAAIAALECTGDPVGTIAADVGFENQAAFAKAFRAYMGVGPTEYRKVAR